MGNRRVGSYSWYTVSYDGDSSDQWRVRHSQPSTEENIQESNRWSDIQMMKSTNESPQWNSWKFWFLCVLARVQWSTESVSIALWAYSALKCFCALFSVFTFYIALYYGVKCHTEPQWHSDNRGSVTQSADLGTLHRSPLPPCHTSDLRDYHEYIKSVGCLLWFRFERFDSAHPTYLGTSR